MKNKIANTVQPLLTSDPSLAEDLATLLALADWNGLSPLESGFLSGFLPAIAARLYNDKLNENAGVSQITLLGGAFVGKSTVVNFLAGERLAESGVGTRHARLPLAVRIGCQQDVADAAPIPAPLDDHQYRRVVATQSPMGCSSLVWDASEATTHGALGEGIKQLGALVASSAPSWAKESSNWERCLQPAMWLFLLCRLKVIQIPWFFDCWNGARIQIASQWRLSRKRPQITIALSRMTLEESWAIVCLGYCCLW